MIPAILSGINRITIKKDLTVYVCNKNFSKYNIKAKLFNSMLPRKEGEMGQFRANNITYHMTGSASGQDEANPVF